jgi:ribonuclease HI
MYLINTDCSIEPCNPGGILAWAFIVKQRRQEIYRECGISGRGEGTTNNIGEYHAVIAALYWLIRLPEQDQHPAVIQSDSQLIVNQCLGIWSVNDEKLVPLHRLVVRATDRYDKSITFKWISREQNKEADAHSRTAYDPDEVQALRDTAMQRLFGDDDVPW